MACWQTMLGTVASPHIASPDCTLSDKPRNLLIMEVKAAFFVKKYYYANYLCK